MEATIAHVCAPVNSKSAATSDLAKAANLLYDPNEMAPARVAEGRTSVSVSARAAAESCVRLLGDYLKRGNWTIRDVERRLGWGNGTLHHLLAYRTPIRYSQVVTVLETIGADPGRFFAELWKQEKQGREQQADLPKLIDLVGALAGVALGDGKLSEEQLRDKAGPMADQLLRAAREQQAKVKRRG